MCGIYGSTGLRVQNKKFISSVKSSLHLRGPDAFNYLYKENQKLFLAHARLSIIDKSSNGLQPMMDYPTKNIIVFNGEIYNYRELKKELISNGEFFKSKTDTEVILKGYKLWGYNFFTKLRGMFAFGIWDYNKNELIICRDRLGEKPLYFHQNNNAHFIFSSSLKTILLNRVVERNIDTSVISDYLKRGYVETDKSIISQIKKLKPGHFAVIKNNNIIKMVEYWNLAESFRNKKKYKSFNEAQDECYGLLKGVTKNQLSATDVPIGSFLSGGVDSTLISGISGELKDEIFTYSAGFNDPKFSELNEAKINSNILNLRHKPFVIDDLTFNEVLEPFNHIDEPFADNSLIPTFYLSKKTRGEVTVALSGDGGDELFLGYETYFADRLYNLSTIFPRSFFSLSSQVSDKFNSKHGKVDMNYKIKSFLKGSQYDFEQAHESWRQIFDGDEINKLTGLKTKYKKSHHWNELNGSHFLDRSSYYDIKTWLVDDILFKVDRMSMGNSLETRCPFLDHKFVEFAASLPNKYKIRFLKNKYILKSIINKKYNISFKKKKGFNAPAAQWISSFYEEFREYLLTSKLWDSSALNSLLKDHKNFRSDNNYKIIALVGYTKWLENINSINVVDS